MAVAMFLLLMLGQVIFSANACGLVRDGEDLTSDVFEGEGLDVRTQINIMRRELDEVRAELQHEKGKVATLEHSYTALQKQMTSLEAEMVVGPRLPRHALEENQIAFSVVSHNNFGAVSSDTNIPFAVVYANEGDGWQPDTNEFHPPKDGYYLFSASIMGRNEMIAQAAIVHTTSTGSSRIASLYSASGIYMADANVAIRYIEVGHSVSVKLQPQGDISSAPSSVYSTFSGFFLFA